MPDPLSDPRPAPVHALRLAALCAPLLALSGAGGTVGAAMGVPAAPAASSPAPDGPSPAAVAPRTVSADTLPPAVDHHVHVWSPDGREAILEFQERTGEQVMDPEEVRPLGADEVVAALDSAGVERAVLLSTAYIFASPELTYDDERARVRAANDYVARQVAARPDRLTGFFSVDPLAPYALEEMERLADDDAFTGLKLHLANSDVDLRDEGDRARLREVFRRADELGLPVVVHLWTRTDDYGARDVNAFVDHVLPAAPDVTIQVAHLGGGGGFDATTREAARAFAAALEDHPERTRNLVFDMSAVAAPRHLAKGDSALLERIEKMNRGFAAAVRELGPDRVLYGTDWPATSMPRYLDGLREALPLSEEAFRDLVDDRAAYLE